MPGQAARRGPWRRRGARPGELLLGTHACPRAQGCPESPGCACTMQTCKLASCRWRRHKDRLARAGVGRKRAVAPGPSGGLQGRGAGTADGSCPSGTRLPTVQPPGPVPGFLNAVTVLPLDKVLLNPNPAVCPSFRLLASASNQPQPVSVWLLPSVLAKLLSSRSAPCCSVQWTVPKCHHACRADSIEHC